MKYFPTRIPVRLARLSIITAALGANFAATAADPETIVVSATRFAAPIVELPIGIRIITAADITGSGANNLGEVFSRLGGIMTRNSAGDGNVQLDLRGFGTTGDQNTLVLLDGQRLSENEQVSARLSTIPLDSVERIEILPGAGAVLYGSGATGGTVNIITKTSAANSGLHGRGSLSLGSYSQRIGNAGASYGGEMFGANLAASDTRSDNYRRNNNVDEQSVSAKLNARFDRGAAWVKFDSAKTKAGLPGPLSDIDIDDDPRQTNNPLDKMKTKNTTTGAGGRVSFGENEFAIDATNRDRHYDSFAPSFAAGATNSTRVNANSVSPRLRVPYQMFGLFSVLVVGADHTDWDYRRNLSLPAFFYSSDIAANQKDKSAYFQNRIALNDATHAIFGARRQKTDIDMQERSFPTPVQEQSDKLTAFETGIRHALDSAWSASARWGQSFRVANVDDNGFTNTGTLLKPQTSHDTELAVERRVDGSQLRLAAFQSLVVNEIHFLATPSFGFFNGANTNLPPTRHRGIETDLRQSLLESLTLTANYRYTQAKYREGTFSGFDISGNDIPLVPEHRASLGTEWKARENLVLNTNVRYVGAQRFDNDQVNVNPKMPSYTVADVRVSQRLGQWLLAFNVNNVFDKQYYSYGLISAPGASGFNAYPETGRVVSASAEWAF